MFPRSSEPITQAEEPSAYMTFGRSEWATLRSTRPLALSDTDLTDLRGLNDPIALDEVADIYLPLSRLLKLHIAAARNLGRVKDAFLGRPAGSPPYIIALAGSVAVGKSTFARVPRPPRPVAGSSTGRARDDRRVPLPQSHSGETWVDAAQGISRKLRPPPHGVVLGRRESGET
jgi:hypothetical protein